jgi:hypothetical protein
VATDRPDPGGVALMPPAAAPGQPSNPGVIDPDGVGKTTPVRMVVGEENPDAGILSLCETVRLA